MIIRCEICHAELANSIEGHRAHLKRFHSVESLARALELRPENHTGRTKEQIVVDAEKRWLGPFIITANASDDIHLEACRCETCFQKRLDALVAHSEKSMNEIEWED